MPKEEVGSVPYRQDDLEVCVQHGYRDVLHPVDKCLQDGSGRIVATPV